MANDTVNDVCMVTMPMDAFDSLSAKLKILDANLALVIGEGFENFSRYSDEIQGAYLWGCQQLASECNELAETAAGVK